MIKYSIIMPFYKRSEQFRTTLISFDHHYAPYRNDYEIIIGEDLKNFQNPEEAEALRDIIEEYKGRINIVLNETYFPGVLNPCLSYNSCVKKSSGEFLVITNPECFHKSNILQALDGIFSCRDDIYVIFGCESAVGCSKDIKKFEDFKYSHHMWYQHASYNNRMLHFCSAISRKNYDKIEGFDENYRFGVAYDDDDFRNKVKAHNLPIFLDDNSYVVHIDHDRTFQADMSLIQINLDYYKKKWES